MAITREIAEAFVRGDELPNDVILDLDRSLDDPDSELSRLCRKRSDLTRLMFDPNGPQFGPTESEFRSLLTADVVAASDLLAKGQSEAAVALACEVYERAKNVWGEEHRDTVTYLNGLARLHYSSGDYQSAAHTFEKAVEIRTRVMGAEHSDTAISLTGLARTREAQGNYVAAVGLHRRALSIMEATLGPNHPDTGVNLNDLGCVLHTIGEHAEAKRLLERALEISRDFDGEIDRNTAIVMGNLGGALEGLGLLAQAKTVYDSSMAILNAIPGVDISSYRWALMNQASVSVLLGDANLALTLSIQALAAQFGDTIDERIAEATIRNNLGMTYQILGDMNAAQTEFRFAMTLLRPVINSDHPLVQAIKLNLAKSDANYSAVAQATNAEWEAIRLVGGTNAVPVAISGTTGIWSVAWEGQSYSLLVSVAA